MPSDITQAIEQDAIADTLVAPLQSSYDTQDSGSDYRHADGAEGVDYGQEQEQTDDEAQDLSAEPGEILEATPEQREAYQQEIQQWQSLPQEQQAHLADQYLEQGYADAYASISPQEAENFTNRVGEQWGNPNLSAVVDPVTFATFADTWSQNVEATIALYPDGPAFL